mgnify:CR=1 FL=1
MHFCTVRKNPRRRSSKYNTRKKLKLEPRLQIDWRRRQKIGCLPDHRPHNNHRPSNIHRLPSAHKQTSSHRLLLLRPILLLLFLQDSKPNPLRRDIQSNHMGHMRKGSKDQQHSSPMVRAVLPSRMQDIGQDSKEEVRTDHSNRAVETDHLIKGINPGHRDNTAMIAPQVNLDIIRVKEPAIRPAGLAAADIRSADLEAKADTRIADLEAKADQERQELEDQEHRELADQGHHEQEVHQQVEILGSPTPELRRTVTMTRAQTTGKQKKESRFL